MRYRNTIKARIMQAKYASICPETGKNIKVGDYIAYFYDSKKAYAQGSKSYEALDAEENAESGYCY